MKKYFGIFQHIKDSYPEYIHEVPLYYEEAATLYDQLSVSYDDYPAFYEHALLYGSPVLELCCGSGRITLPLLKAGFGITAVDLSDDMLAKLQIQLNGRYRRFSSNIDVVKADMTKLQLNDKYNLIIIGATSIRLMEEDFTAFFNQMYAMLNDGGCFLFNFEDIPDCINEKEVYEQTLVTDLKEDTGVPSIMCMQRMINYDDKRASVNFIKTMWDEKKILLTQTDYRIFSKEDIKKHAIQSNFKSCEIVHVNQNNYFCKMIRNT